jgi:hypothetical protein
MEKLDSGYIERKPTEIEGMKGLKGQLNGLAGFDAA